MHVLATSIAPVLPLSSNDLPKTLRTPNRLAGVLRRFHAPRPHGPGPVTTTRGPKGRRAAAAGALALLISDGWAAQQASAGAAATALATTTSSLAATVSSLGEARGGSPAACLSADSYPLKPSSKSRA